MYAADNLSDALQITKRYLGSLGFAGYLKLALVVLFIGGLGVTNQLTSADTQPIVDAVEGSTGVGFELALFALGVGLYVGFRYLAAVLEFVFVESLRSESMHIRTYARENLRHALWLVLFRAGLWLVLLAVVGSVVAAIVFGANVSGVDDVTPGHVVVILGTGFVAYVGLWAVYTLTTAFVVPVMLLENRGPVGAWRRVAPTLRSNWSGALAFLAVAWVIGTILWFVFAIVGMFVMIVGLFLGLFGFVVATEIDESLVYVVSVLGLLAYVVYQYVLSLVEAPVRSYVRYYALLLLGDTDESLDCIPDQRAAVRADGGPATGTDRAGGTGESTNWGTASTDEWGHDATASRTDRSSQSARSRDTGDTSSTSGSSGDQTETDSWGGDAVWDESSGWSESSGWGDNRDAVRSADHESPQDPVDDEAADEYGDPGTDSSTASGSDEPDDPRS